MPRILIRNGYVVTVDSRRQVFPDGFVAVDGSGIAAVGPSAQTPAPDAFDEVIDAAGSIVVPGLINMHQHHWYTLFKGIADGMLLEDWVSDILLPLSLLLDEPAIHRFRSRYRELFGNVGSDDSLYESVSAGRRYAGMEHWLPFYYEQLETLFDYLPEAAVTLDYQAVDVRDVRLATIADFYAARRAVTPAMRGAAMPVLPMLARPLRPGPWQVPHAAVFLSAPPVSTSSLPRASVPGGT